jgi:hypothetical protein
MAIRGADMPKRGSTALPDDLKAAFEQDGDTYTADEAKLTKQASRKHDSNAEDGTEGDEQTASPKLPAEADELPEFTVKLDDADYDKLPVDMRDLYERDGDTWVAIPQLRTEIERVEAQFQELLARKDAEIAEKQAKAARLEQQLGEAVTTSAVRTLLAGAGCRPGLLKAAVRTFISETTIERIRGADGEWHHEVSAPDGVISLESAVELWLHTEIGSAMLTNPVSRGRMH